MVSIYLSCLSLCSVPARDMFMHILCSKLHLTLKFVSVSSRIIFVPPKKTNVPLPDLYHGMSSFGHLRHFLNQQDLSPRIAYGEHNDSRWELGGCQTWLETPPSSKQEEDHGGEHHPIPERILGLVRGKALGIYLVTPALITPKSKQDLLQAGVKYPQDYQRVGQSVRKKSSPSPRLHLKSQAEEKSSQFLSLPTRESSAPHYSITFIKAR